MISAFKRLPGLLLEHKVEDPLTMENIKWLAALPRGEAVAIHQSCHHTYVRIYNRGKREHFYCEKCSRYSNIGALLILGDNLYIIHSNGKVFETSLNNNHVMSVYQIKNVVKVVNYGSLYSDPDSIPDKDVLLLVDNRKNEVFTYNMSSHQKIVRIRRIPNPTSVTYSFYNNTTFYIVCVRWEHSIYVYYSQWQPVRRFGTNSERQYTVGSAIMSLEETIFVVNSSKVSEFTLQGQFIGHIISMPDTITSVSFRISFHQNKRTETAERYQSFTTIIMPSFYYS